MWLYILRKHFTMHSLFISCDEKYMKLNLFFYVTTFLAATSFIAPNQTFAKDNIVILDGREILLKDNGSWEYISNNRYAITQDGRQVILKENGEWEYAKKQEQVNVTPAPTPDKNTDILVMQLQKAEVESIIKKKNKRTSIKTQSAFFIDINLASHAHKTFMLSDSDKENISVTDDKNNQYKVLSIQPQIRLKPGETGTVQIRVDNSPSILDKVTFMYVNFSPAVNGISKKITIKARWNDFIQKSVNEFNY